MTTGYRLKQYVRHLRKAKGRHGVHSPFVYALIEDVLQNKAADDNALILVTRKHKKLINQLVAYFECRSILWLANHHGEQETFITITPVKDGEVQLKSEPLEAGSYEQYPQPDLLLIDLRDPSDWQHAYEKYRFRLKNESFVLINSIHFSKQHTAAWEQIASSEDVRLSLDLFKIGLLFFREEFKEKQQFLLKH